MGLRINTNIAALNAHRNLVNTDNRLSKNLERLSSGYRINHASDDAAGLAIANRFRTSIRSLTVAQRNITEANSVVQVAEGAANQIQDILERLKELATQAASDNAATDRDKLNNEATQLISELDRIADSTNYQGKPLINGHYGDYVSAMSDTDGDDGLVTSSIILNGADTGTYTITDSASGGESTITITNGSVTQQITGVVTGAQTLNFDALGIKLNLTEAYDPGDLNNDTFEISAGNEGVFQVGDKNLPSNQITGVDFGDLKSNAIGSGSGSMVSDINLSTRDGAEQALDILDDAVNDVADTLGKLGAYMNRLSYASANVSVTLENYSASESVIRDVDMAGEMTEFTKNQILLQAGTAMLAQANAAPQQVLALFQYPLNPNKPHKSRLPHPGRRGFFVGSARDSVV